MASSKFTHSPCGPPPLWHRNYQLRPTTSELSLPSKQLVWLENTLNGLLYFPDVSFHAHIFLRPRCHTVALKVWRTTPVQLRQPQRGFLATWTTWTRVDPGLSVLMLHLEAKWMCTSVRAAGTEGLEVLTLLWIDSKRPWSFFHLFVFFLQDLNLAPPYQTFCSCCLSLLKKYWRDYRWDEPWSQTFANCICTSSHHHIQNDSANLFSQTKNLATFG